MSCLRLFPFFIIALSISSCTSFQNFTVEQDAEAMIPEDVRVIGVINNILTVNSERVSTETLEEQQKTRNQAASDMATNGAFNSIIAQRGRVRIYENDSVTHVNGGLDWIYIDSIAAIDSVDVFVELSEFKASTTIGTAVLSAITGQPASQKLKGTLSLNIRVVGSDSLLGQYSVDGFVTYPISGSIIDVEADVQRKRNAYERLGYNLGFSASDLMYSHRLDVRRMYYTSGSPGVKASKKMMDRSNWIAAETELLKYADDGKPGPRGRTLYNLAVVKEAQGDLDMAIEYAERSAFECFNSNGKVYLKKLQKRKGIVADSI